jgi:Right handed beta helix region
VRAGEPQLISRFCIVAAAALLAAPATASAADTFVDEDTGDDSNPCTQPQPCATIQQGVTVASAGATVFVDSDLYSESVTLDEGKSLADLEFVPGESALPTIDGGSSEAIHVPEDASAGTIGAFNLLSSTVPVLLAGPATLHDDVFEGESNVAVSIQPGAAGSVIEDSNFGDPDSAGEESAIEVGDSARIEGNLIDGYFEGIGVVEGARPTITGNHIVGTHGVSSVLGGDVVVGEGRPTLVGNTIELPSGDSIGVTGGGEGSGVVMRRNTILDHLDGVFFDDGPLGVELNGDVIAGSAGYGISARTFSFETPLSATNVTLLDNAVADVAAQDNDVTIDSSILEDPIETTGSVNCTIRFSRGPTTSGTVCERFQTTADPLLVNPASDDFHLAADSPMIEAGNPAPPAAGILDLDGAPRACDGDGDGVVRRDIGADEIRTPANDDCRAPDTAIKGVKVKRRRRRATITFGSADPDARYECKLDARPFAPCSSPVTYRRLKRGHHTFQVRATDSFGNRELAAAVRSFRVRPRRR